MRHNRSTRILVVDDEPKLLQSLDYILSRQGFTVEAVDSAEAALAAIEAGAPDVVLTDVYMSGSDGLELISTLRKRVRTFPIVAMSGGVASETLVFARRLGADAAIRKPFHKTELVDLLDYCLKKAA
jgi:DNA-binding response OmpR family regulator